MHGFKSFARKTEIVFDRGINVIIGPNGSGKCVRGDSIVNLGDGNLQRIDEIVNTRLEKSAKTEDGFIIPGDGTEVMCLDLNTLKMVKKPVKAFVKRSSPESLLSIETRSGKKLTATKYHPLFILKDGQVVPARADELKAGMRIAIPREMRFKPDTLYFTELLDSIAAEDGLYAPSKAEFASILRSLKQEHNCEWKVLSEKLGVPHYALKSLLDKQSVNFYTLIRILKAARLKEEETLDLLNDISSHGKESKIPIKNSPDFARFLGYLLAEGRLSNSGQVWFTNGDREIIEDYISLVKKLFNEEVIAREYKPRCWDVIIFSEPLIKLLRKFGMASETENKQISDLFFKHASEKEIAGLLNGLYCGDGYATEHSIEITTKSVKLARGIENCLLRLGIMPRTREVVKGIKETGFIGNYLSICVYGVENLTKFRKFIKLVHKRKNALVEKAILKKANPNCDLIEVNTLLKEIVKECGIKIKPLHSTFPRLDSYCYTNTLPSRNGLSLLLQNVLTVESPNREILNKLANSEIFWDELKEIKEVNGGGWVYDLCVDEHHNFIANNIIVHNSNISDALCFVLGRLSIKSIRAAKSKNLLFMGSKYIKPAREAYVELVFDNTDRAISIDQDEVTIKRIVKYNGQSIYKINDEVKTRIEIIEMLAQAGIDPHGFNLILQGQIQAVVKMHPEERRKIIEEVAGISIYELRKEKSLHELDKTEEKLKEVSAILRERTVYMRNLDKERSQALRFKELEGNVKRIRGSIIHKKMEDKQKELDSIEKSISAKTEQKDKIKSGLEKLQQIITDMSERINQINKDIQQSTGLEQDTLHNQIANLKAEIEGLKVRKENYEHRKDEIERRIEEMGRSIPDIEGEIKELKQKSPLMAKKSHELKKKKEELAQIGEERKKVLTFKTELSSISERIKDRERQVTHNSAESESVLRQLEEYSRSLAYNSDDECRNKVKELKENLARKRGEIDSLHKTELENERAISVSESEIDRHSKTVGDVQKIDICPLCQSKITQEHIDHVIKDANDKIKISRTKLLESQQQLEEIKSKREKIWGEIQEIGDKISRGEIELLRHRSINEKKEQLKRMVEREHALKDEIKMLQERAKSLENKTLDFSKVDENYNSKILEIEEISSRTEEDVDTTLLYKERELEKIRNIITGSKQDIKDIENYIKGISVNLQNKSGELEHKEDIEKKLNEKFKKMFEKRDELQKEIQEKSVEASEVQNNMRQIEDQINYLKIGKAKLDAEKESLDMEISDYSGIEYIQASINSLEERLTKTQDALREIGSINMRALEIYDEIKKEYDEVQEKVNTIERERLEIMKIIEEIDMKKRKSFMKAFRGINELFTRNFSQLYSKGIAFLELENKEDIFAGGVNIVVRLAKGKYFDVTSLSGGEQTLVALSLLFAIQEYKPYHFYIFDEIDAALDKRNSERLSALLGQYMKSGQYIVITHNDAIIMNSNILYGVSMHDGVSKTLSLKMGGPLPPEVLNPENSNQTSEGNNLNAGEGGETNEYASESSAVDEQVLEEAPLSSQTLDDEEAEKTEDEEEASEENNEVMKEGNNGESESIEEEKSS